MPVPAEIWNRVLHVRNPRNGGTGSAFVIEVDGNEYICSARHIFEGGYSNIIEIRYNHNWVPVPIDIIGAGLDDDDVIVMRSTEFRKIVPGSFPVLTSTAKMVITQEAFLLGYPFRWESYLKGISNEWPFPIVKHAIITSMPTDDRPRQLILDCQINSGFSGGPVALNILGTKNWAIVGIIKGSYNEPVSDSKGLLTTPVPTGFSVATDIHCVTNLISGRSSNAPVE